MVVYNPAVEVVEGDAEVRVNWIVLDATNEVRYLLEIMVKKDANEAKLTLIPDTMSPKFIVSAMLNTFTAKSDPTTSNIGLVFIGNL